MLSEQINLPTPHSYTVYTAAVAVEVGIVVVIVALLQFHRMLELVLQTV